MTELILNMSDNQETINMTVVFDNRRLKLKCSDQLTILGLKIALEDDYGIPRDDQILFVDGVEGLRDLDDDEVLLKDLGTTLISMRLSVHRGALVNPCIVLPNHTTYQTIHHKLSKVKKVKADVFEHMLTKGMDVGDYKNILLRCGDVFWNNEEDNLFQLGVQNDTELECLIVDRNQPPPGYN